MAKPIINFIAIALICFVCLSHAGCKFFTIAPLEVTAVSPDSPVTDTTTLAQIGVWFSADANTSLVEKAFSLSKDGISVEGSFYWPEKDHLVFRPFEPFQTNPVYTIKVTTMAEDTEGNSLLEDFQHIFRGTADSVRPEIISIIPADMTSLDTLRPTIEIQFSKEMDISSVLDGFSLNPNADGYLVESGGNTIFNYILTEDLLWQETYTITIADNVSDINGNMTGEVGEFHFYTGNENMSPTILSISNPDNSITLIPDDPHDGIETINTGWEKDYSLVISFSEEMDRDTVRSGVSITPEIEFDSDWNASGDILTITPTEFFHYDTLYALLVSTACSDLQGNQMEDELSFKFMINGPHSLPPTVEAINLLNVFSGSVPSDVVPLTNLGGVELDAEYGTGPTVGFFDIYLRLAESADLDVFAFIDSFTLSATGASIIPEACQKDSEINFCSEIPPDASLLADPAVHVLRYIVTIDNSGSSYSDVPGSIQFTLDESFQDSLQNSPVETWHMTTFTTN
jgi:hypothetical protein